MPGKMNSICENCGGEVLYEKDSTGDEVRQTDPEEFASLCAICSAKSGASTDKAVKESETNTDFDDEHNKALRTGREIDQL